MKRTIVIFGSLALAACVGDDAAIAGYGRGQPRRVEPRWRFGLRRRIVFLVVVVVWWWRRRRRGLS